MPDPWGRLRIDVVDDEIIIDLPATTYSVTYYKPANRLNFSRRISRKRMIGARHSNCLTFLLELGRQRTTRRASSGGLCDAGSALASMASIPL
jgi:hypothetical protein